MSASVGDTLPLRNDHDIVMARQLVRKLSLELSFSLVDQTKIITAASELARNTVLHGGGGTMSWEVVLDGARKGLRLVFEDKGRGIPNMELAMKDGWTSGTGMGMGLPGTRRLVNDFDIQSKPGEGTRVTIARWR